MNGRSRRLSLDRYLWLATRGLPKRVRLDTAAELRVHLLERIRALEGQGFPRGEAEHVAVSEMGLPEGTNRAFLKHFFTYKTGWIVLGLAALSAGIWWGKDNLFPRAAGVQLVELGTPELSFIANSEELRNARNFQAFRIFAPAGATGIEIALFKNGVGSVQSMSLIPHPGFNALQAPQYTLPQNYRYEMTAVLATNDQNCRGVGSMVFGLLQNKRPQSSSTTVGSSACSPETRTHLRYWSTSPFPYSDTRSDAVTLPINTWVLLSGRVYKPDGPQYSKCYVPGKSSPACKNFYEINHRPDKHWDKFAYFGVRAVDAATLKRFSTSKNPVPVPKLKYTPSTGVHVQSND